MHDPKCLNVQCHMLSQVARRMRTLGSQGRTETLSPGTLVPSGVRRPRIILVGNAPTSKKNERKDETKRESPASALCDVACQGWHPSLQTSKAQVRECEVQVRTNSRARGRSAVDFGGVFPRGCRRNGRNATSLKHNAPEKVFVAVKDGQTRGLLLSSLGGVGEGDVSGSSVALAADPQDRLVADACRTSETHRSANPCRSTSFAGFLSERRTSNRPPPHFLPLDATTLFLSLLHRCRPQPALEPGPFSSAYEPDAAIGEFAPFPAIPAATRIPGNPDHAMGPVCCRSLGEACQSRRDAGSPWTSVAPAQFSQHQAGSLPKRGENRGQPAPLC